MAGLALDHVNIRTTRLAESIAFYGGVIGLEMRPPPTCADMTGGAYGHDESGRAVLHLVGVAQEAPSLPPVRGAAQRGMIDHVAFRCDDVEPVAGRLVAHGLAFERKDVAMLGMRLLFVRDPNEVLVEIGAPLPTS